MVPQSVWKPGSFGYLWQVALALINTLQDYYYNQPFIKHCRITTTAWLFDLFYWELIYWSKLGRSKVMITLPDMKVILKVILSWFNIDKINSRSWKRWSWYTGRYAVCNSLWVTFTVSLNYIFDTITNLLWVSSVLEIFNVYYFI